MHYQILDGGALREWREFVERCPMATEDHLVFDLGHPSSSQCSRVLVARENGRITSGAHVIMRKNKLVPGCVLRIEGGALYDRLIDANELDALLDAVCNAFGDEHPIFVEWSLRLPRVIESTEVPEHRFITEWMEKRKLLPRPELEATFWVDLSGTEDELAERTHKNFRRDFRKAEREGVTVRQVGSERIDRFYDMSQEMDRIKSLGSTYFRLATREQFTSFVGGLLNDGAAALFAAEWQGSIRNMALVTTVGTPRYKYGATGAEARGDVRPPPTGQLLHWEIMKWLRSQSAVRYDLGGTPGRELAADHPNFGVWQFKRRMGGQYIEFFTRSRLVRRPLLMKLYQKMRG
ncbi:MAG: peptidoglycan bridge formation glycyltransferase FemA/FemB family protein [Planctomycetes bacterium]|nr:peptidoglycan bridge formation glycyltransferase FemA/FemB family protein [Planctomycetota bacterium]